MLDLLYFCFCLFWEGLWNMCHHLSLPNPPNLFGHVPTSFFLFLFFFLFQIFIKTPYNWGDSQVETTGMSPRWRLLYLWFWDYCIIWQDWFHWLEMDSVDQLHLYSPCFYKIHFIFGSCFKSTKNAMDIYALISKVCHWIFESLFTGRCILNSVLLESYKYFVGLLWWIQK